MTACKTCFYWEMVDSTIGETSDQSIWGFCKRYPPIQTAEMNDYDIYINQHPVTDGVEWCGEYKKGRSQ